MPSDRERHEAMEAMYRESLEQFEAMQPPRIVEASEPIRADPVHVEYHVESHIEPIPLPAELHARVRNGLDAMSRELDREILGVLSFNGVDCNSPTAETVSQVPASSLTIEDLRRAHAFLRANDLQEQQRERDRGRNSLSLLDDILAWESIFYGGRGNPKPTLADVKRLAAQSGHGHVGVMGDKGQERRYISMGCVKRCDEHINWPSEAMERGEAWAQRGIPWQVRVGR